MVHLLLKKKRHFSTILLPQATVRDYQIEQYLGYTYSKKTFVVYLKFRFSLVFCIVSGNPTAVTFLLGGEWLTRALFPDPGWKQDQRKVPVRMGSLPPDRTGHPGCRAREDPTVPLNFSLIRDAANLNLSRSFLAEKLRIIFNLVIFLYFFFFCLSCREHFISLGSCSETHEIDTLKMALF